MIQEATPKPSHMCNQKPFMNASPCSQLKIVGTSQHTSLHSCPLRSPLWMASPHTQLPSHCECPHTCLLWSPLQGPPRNPLFPTTKHIKKPMLKSLHTSIWKVLGVALYSGHKVIGCNGILVMSCCKVMKLHGDTKSLQEIKILTKLHGRFHNNQKCNICGGCC